MYKLKTLKLFLIVLFSINLPISIIHGAYQQNITHPEPQVDKIKVGMFALLCTVLIGLEIAKYYFGPSKACKSCKQYFENWKIWNPCPCSYHYYLYEPHYSSRFSYTTMIPDFAMTYITGFPMFTYYHHTI